MAIAESVQPSAPAETSEVSAFHRVFSVVGLIALSGCGASIVLRLFPLGAVFGSSLPFVILTSTIYLIAFCLVVNRLVSFFVVVTKNLALFALLVLAWMSLGWTPDFDLTLQRLIALTGTMIFAVYLSLYFDEEEGLKRIIWALALIAVFSFVIIFLDPSFGIQSGEWRGLYGHKNGLGREMALAAILFFLFLPQEWGRRTRLMLVAITVVMVLFSKSGQGQVLAAFVIPAGLVLRRFFRRGALFICGSLILSIVVLILAMPVYSVIQSTVLDSMGRDETLTGRTELWKTVIEDTMRYHPMLGYGYTGALQLGGDRFVLLGTDVAGGHAHNGYIQLFSELGFVGISLFALLSIQLWKNLILRAMFFRTLYDQFMIVFMCYFYVLSIVASPILDKNSIIWLCFVYVAIRASQRPALAQLQGREMGQPGTALQPPA